MNNILQIDSSIFGDKGESARLTNRLVSGLMAKHRHTTLTHRDLGLAPVPHFDAQTIGAIGENQALLADTLIQELKDADVLVLGVPMYNFAVPSQLKAWFDHITRAGETFKYTPDGPVGLLGSKKIVVITTSGGKHANTARDAVEPWLNTILNFVGLDQDSQFIRAEGLAISDFKETSRQQAEKEVDEIISSLAE